MLYFAMVYVLAAAAISNMTIIMAESDPLESTRLWLQARLPKISKLFECKYCLSFWLSGLAGLLSIIYVPIGLPDWLQWSIVWYSMHFVVFFMHNVYDRTANDAPTALYVMTKKMDSSDDGEKV